MPKAKLQLPEDPMDQTPLPELLTSSEVAEIFRVNPRTVHRWADAGSLSSIRTVGGRRRYDRHEVENLLEGGRKERDPGA